MTNPRYKIETYTGAVLDHTIEGDAADIYTKEILTDGIGHFAAILPRMVGSNDYVYTDIALQDKVKFYFYYADIETCPSTPNFVGIINKIDTPCSDKGMLLQISGLSQGEILLRRQKTNKYYNAVDADVIAGDVATDLSLGTSFSADAADDYHVTLEVKTKSYFDIMQYISDYYSGAAQQIKKDFYIDVGDAGHTNGHLVWKTRPFRTAGVETLTVGKNIISYDVLRDLDSVRNNITVYGAAEKPLPSDKDSWTEVTTNWTASAGTVDRTDVNPKVGTWSIEGETGAGAAISQFKRTFDRITIRDINQVVFWHRVSAFCDDAIVRLHAPDSSNFFYDDSLSLAPAATWLFNSITLGQSNEYDANANPNGKWKKTGSPNWWDIQAIEFRFTHSVNDCGVGVDGLYFFPERWSDTTSEAASITSYAQRDYEVTDDKLHSDSDCEARSETLLFQKKDPPTQLEVLTTGNTNILVGDRLSMTIPAESISAANYDVFAVEHFFDKDQGFRTKATMVNTSPIGDANIRTPISKTGFDEIIKAKRILNKLGQDVKIVG